MKRVGKLTVAVLASIFLFGCATKGVDLGVNGPTIVVPGADVATSVNVGSLSGVASVTISSSHALKLPGRVDLAVVPVKYGTSRSLISKPQDSARYGINRLKAGYPEIGTAFVTIPVLVHKVGEVERPFFDFLENEKQHVVIQAVERESKKVFYEQLRAAVATRPNKTAFVFVHGYNVTFEEAARRTAQISYDLKEIAVPAFFSWPSRGNVVPYAVDESNSEWTIPHLKTFLRDFAVESKAERIILLAHSMGSRPATKALAALVQENPAVAARFSAVILAAPDLDADIFVDQIAPHFVSGKFPVTIYASNADKALWGSNTLHGKNRPLGYINADSVFVHPSFETIDASGVDTDWLAHSYYGSSPVLIEDIKLIISERKPASERKRLSPVSKDGRSWWVIK